MQFLAIQTGARRSYAVPLLLKQAGMLDRFHTDIAGNVGIGRLASLFRFAPGLGHMVDALSRRTLPHELVPKTKTFPGPMLSHLMRQRFGSSDPSMVFRRQLDFPERWGRAMIPSGFGCATHVYSMLNEAGPLLDAAKSCGLKTVSEVYILLSTERVLAEEQKRFPEWEPGAPDFSSLRRRHIPQDPYPRNIDLCLCPSEAVRDDLVSHWGIVPERTAVVPYGMSPHWLDLEPRPEPGRVLFVGTAELRKGIHYLAMAAEILNQRGFRGEIRIAGNVTEAVRSQPICRHLNFLGRIPRNRIHEEFQAADLFVLPSLAEGSAEVTYEALAAAVPQIVTPSAGSVARDGIEGLIISERDPEALATAIERGVNDRNWRDEASKASRARALDFTWQRYGEKLISALLDAQTIKQ